MFMTLRQGITKLPRIVLNSLSKVSASNTCEYKAVLVGPSEGLVLTVEIFIN